ncbi:hypothetical protein NDU88_003116 [Pleurodeles waltl]|uniref:Uncharacterized protein n=1 Tax=Pleurodeles waltl TaxID=8319 RepID=A0AAV7L581_PLEWA|nr:hypothetical protein NDU88_003116 [Pleurodeles waltl]
MHHVQEGTCDGPLFRQADLSCRTATDAASSDPEELAASSNPLPLLGNGGQEEVMRAFWGRKREYPTWTGKRGASGGEEETRGCTVCEDGKEDFAESSWHSVDHPEESEVREAPSASSGHA